ncbi:hypothetical protein VTK26DRAFT_2477 [Humicola hyalothermophila]
MTAVLMAPRSIDSGLPPMPRRQSCDRCHEQKVRCVPEGAKAPLTLGGIGEGSEASFSGQVTACVRCRKARAVCVYSPQLRSGRPRLHRDSSAPPPRRQIRRVSRCSSSSSLNSSLSPVLSPQSSAQPSMSSFPSNASGLGILDLEHQSQSLLEHAVSQTSPLRSPEATTPRCSAGNQSVPGLDTPSINDQWLMSPFCSDGNQFLTGMSPLASFSQATADSAVPCDALFADLPRPNVPSTREVPVQYPWAHSGSPANSDLEQLARINLQVHLAGRALPARDNALGLMASPAVDDICSAACSLISLVDRYAAQKAAAFQKPKKRGLGAQPQSSTPPPPTLTNFNGSPMATSPAIDNALDSSTCLMIHSCHQALLGVFEDLSTSFLAHLAQVEKATPPGTPPGPSYFPSCREQLEVVINLFSHLLAQLDRAMGLLSTHDVPLQPLTQGASESKPPETHPTREGKASSRLFMEIDQRQRRVQDLFRMLEQLSTKPDVQYQ